MGTRRVAHGSGEITPAARGSPRAIACTRRPLLDRRDAVGERSRQAVEAVRRRVEAGEQIFGQLEGHGIGLVERRALGQVEARVLIAEQGAAQGVGAELPALTEELTCPGGVVEDVDRARVDREAGAVHELPALVDPRAHVVDVGDIGVLEVGDHLVVERPLQVVAGEAEQPVTVRAAVVDAGVHQVHAAVAVGVERLDLEAVGHEPERDHLDVGRDDRRLGDVIHRRAVGRVATQQQRAVVEHREDAVLVHQRGDDRARHDRVDRAVVFVERDVDEGLARVGRVPEVGGAHQERLVAVSVSVSVAVAVAVSVSVSVSVSVAIAVAVAVSVSVAIAVAVSVSVSVSVSGAGGGRIASTGGGGVRRRTRGGGRARHRDRARRNTRVRVGVPPLVAATAERQQGPRQRDHRRRAPRVKVSRGANRIASPVHG